MTTYSMHAMLPSLTLQDNPLGFVTPVGPQVAFTATYNQLEANQPATFYYSNLGPLWDCNWLSYVTDSPSSPGADVSLYLDGGGTLLFGNFSSQTQSYQAELMSQTLLVLLSSSSYELRYPDGSRREYTQSDGSAGSTRRIFLTQVIDPAGNAVQLNYDSQLRITNIVNAMGQATTLLYTNTAYPFAITSVIDPFGRTAYLQYTTNGLLAQITDVLGLTSQYTYGTNQFINALTTPYGTTTFTTDGASGADVGIYGVGFVTATDPLGGTELVEFSQSSGITPSLPASEVPHGLSTFNAFLNDRDSLYWDKEAYAEGAGDWTKAKLYHWLHDTPDSEIAGRFLESEKDPLESRIWYNYPGQLTNVGAPYYDDAAQADYAATDHPSVVARVMDDGTTQLYYYAYNALGNVTNATDPLGRNFTYVYATNNIDLLEVIMTHNGKDEVQGSVTYNSRHLPLTFTDASGQTTTNTYNSRGQVLSTTDPLGELTTFSYDTNGYLLTITGPLQTATDVATIAYDGFGRVRTTTDTEGYALTYDYDEADRLIQITHPDGTYEQFVYSNLDLVAFADRLGRWTTNIYNANRQLLQTRDPRGRITAYDWCKCGSLTGLTDPMGRTTMWDYDVQSRPIAKHYADGSTISYVYENTTSRLQSRYDEQGQQTLLEYYSDNDLKSVSYPNAIIGTATVTYTYDPDYNRVVTMQDGIGTTAYSYNQIRPIPALGAGQLASAVGPLPNSAVTYQYDQLGRVTNRAINGVAQVIAYDVLGRMSTATNALGVFQYSYVGATTRRASDVYPNGETNLYAYYNNLGDERLRQLQHLSRNGTLLSAFGYSYNAVGKITGWTNQWDVSPTRVWLPSYDAADELTNVVSITGTSAAIDYAYAYDIAGNRTLAQSNTAPNQFYYNALNQLTGATLGPANSATYEWDAENRLTAINQGTARSEFSYDGLGRRVGIVEISNSVVTQTTWFLWCGGELCEERDASGATVLRRFFPQGEMVIAAEGATNLFYTRDHLGSIREAVDSTGTLRSRYDYDPFGQQAILSENLNTSFAFTGDFQHRPSGLYFAFHRGLDPRLGRWLNRDPLGEVAGFNLYAYVGNDPLNQIDPSGDFFFIVIPAIIWGPAIAGAVGAAAYGIYKAAFTDTPVVTTASGAAALVVGGGAAGAAGGAAAAALSGPVATALTAVAAGLGVTVPAGTGVVGTLGVIVNAVIVRSGGSISSILPPGCH
jgi:RHS repeat-associated protein